MTQAGADPSKLNRIISDGSGFEALKDKVDIEWFFEGWDNVKCKLNDFPINYMELRQLDERLDYYTPVIIANNTFLQEHPDIAKKFLEATQKGYEYAIQNPVDAANMLLAGDNTGSLKGSEELVQASQQYISDQYIADAAKWGFIDADRWNAFYSWLAENNLTSTDLTGKGFTNDYLGN